MSEVPQADVIYCYHGCEIFGATAVETGDTVMVLRLSVHEMDSPLSPEHMKSVEIILPSAEGLDLVLSVSAGLAEISRGAKLPAVTIPIQWGSLN